MEIFALRWRAALCYRRSRVGDRTSHGQVNQHRTSSSALLPDRDSTTLRSIRSKVARLACCAPEQIEQLQITRYRVGEYYRPHHDALTPSMVTSLKEQSRGGQRIATVIVYLNSLAPEDTGGQTFFPGADISIRPRAGRAVLWNNCDAALNPLAEAVHEARAPTVGVKYVLSCFIRERPIARYRARR